MNIPDDLRYSSDHEWIRRDTETGVVTIGITDYAQDALGDVVFVDEIDVGEAVAAHDTFTEVESTKSVSDIYAPVSGTVTEVNPAIVERPELLNSDPYGEGWICRITMTDSAQFDALMDAAAYRALTEE
jgi:glycine cleavage system H protein